MAYKFNPFNWGNLLNNPQTSAQTFWGVPTSGNYFPISTSATQPVQPQTPQTNSDYDAYNRARGLLNLKVNSNLPSDQEILNAYNDWRKNNPNAAGQDWKMQLANGVTLTEQNINNILNPYGVGKPEGVPSYVPAEVENRNLLAMRNPNWSEAQYQQALNSLQPYYDYQKSVIPALMPNLPRR